jgi:ElaB/YqjD/DUF883 family membrane-anchored ribosome-binding protein
MNNAFSTAQSVGDLAHDMACSARKTAEDFTATAGHSIKQFGQTLSDHAPQEGMLGSSAQAMANSLQASGEFLEENSLEDMACHVTKLIKKNPVPAVLVGLGIGLLLGRLMRRI